MWLDCVFRVTMTLPLPPSALAMVRAANWPSFTLSDVTNATFGAAVLLAKVTTGICFVDAAFTGSTNPALSMGQSAMPAGFFDMICSKTVTCSGSLYSRFPGTRP